MSQIASTYKAREVEETIDVYFYRPLGYVIAKACRASGVTPNVVTVVSIIIGVFGGHLLYYKDFAINALGFGLWVVADTLDSVDGQLARMTDHESKIGRILDGFGGNLVFLSIYLHLFARMVNTFPDIQWPFLFLLVLAGGVSHSLQSSLADYYRNAYLTFVVESSKSGLDSAEEVRREYEAILLADHPVRKFLMRVYLNYTIQQESLSRNFQKLRKRAAAEFGRNIPDWFRDEYRRMNRPLMKYYAVLTTNTRMIIMAVCVLTDHVPWYFAGEVLGINLVMVLVTMYQERLSAELCDQIDVRQGAI